MKKIHTQLVRSYFVFLLEIVVLFFLMLSGHIHKSYIRLRIWSALLVNSLASFFSLDEKKNSFLFLLRLLFKCPLCRLCAFWSASSSSSLHLFSSTRLFSFQDWLDSLYIHIHSIQTPHHHQQYSHHRYYEHSNNGTKSPRMGEDNASR